MMEKILKNYDQVHRLRFVSLRYFNATGADPDGGLGERHNPESYLIPLVLQTASGQRAQIVIYGDDYPATPDGTCIRDYIHVFDLRSAHLLTLEHLLADGQSEVFNLGIGAGFPVQSVIDTALAVTGRSIPSAVQERRAGASLQ